MCRMSATPAPASGPVVRTDADALRLATVLLQRMRVDSPAGGIWEAADVQWWSRQERVTDRHGQLFWLDERGQPQAAVLTTDFQGTVQCDVLLGPQIDAGLGGTIWRAAIERAGTRPAEFPVRPDDAAGIGTLTAAGYSPADDPGVIASWLAAED